MFMWIVTPPPPRFCLISIVSRTPLCVIPVKINISPLSHVCALMCVYTLGDQKKVLDPMEIRVTCILSYSVWVLGFELWTS